MHRYDYRDILAGALIALVGGVFAYGAASLRLGSPHAMGPGYFPMAVAIITILLGLAIMVPALLRAGALPRLEPRPLIAVGAAILAFGLAIRAFGLVPAILATVALSALGDRTARPIGTIALAVFMALASWLVFSLALGLPMPAFRSPL
jgi:hypothetical protein